MKPLPISRSVSTPRPLSDFRRMSIKRIPCFPPSIFGGELAISQLGPISGNTEGVTNHGPIGTVSCRLYQDAGKEYRQLRVHGRRAGLQPVQLLLETHLPSTATSLPDRIPWLERRESALPVTEWLRRCSASWTVQASEHRPPPMSPIIFLARYVQDDWKLTQQPDF